MSVWFGGDTEEEMRNIRAVVLGAFAILILPVIVLFIHFAWEINNVDYIETRWIDKNGVSYLMRVCAANGMPSTDGRVLASVVVDEDDIFIVDLESDAWFDGNMVSGSKFITLEDAKKYITRGLSMYNRRDAP